MFQQGRTALSRMRSRQELAHTYANRGVSRMFLSKFDEGRRDFERALDIDPSLDEVRRNLGTLFLHVGSAEDAIRVFEGISEREVRQSLTCNWLRRTSTQESPQRLGGKWSLLNEKLLQPTRFC